MLYCRPARSYCSGCDVEINRSENGALTAASMNTLITASVVSVGFGMSDSCRWSVDDFVVVIVFVAPFVASRRTVRLPAPGVSYCPGGIPALGISV